MKKIEPYKIYMKRYGRWRFLASFEYKWGRDIFLSELRRLATENKEVGYTYLSFNPYEPIKKR